MRHLDEPLVVPELQGAGLKNIDGLPDLTERIKKLGLMEEYLAFKDRYLAWRRGQASGARGEIMFDHLTRPGNAAKNRGFRHWYPTVQDWLWSRTMAYWIAVTFFEGSIFFTISSFMYNQKQFLGGMYEPLAMYGYRAGIVCLFVCSYLMCLETINLRRGRGPDASVSSPKSAERKPSDASNTIYSSPRSSERKSSNASSSSMAIQDEPFYYCPFRYEVAFKNGAESGAGRLPYCASITYFLGVSFFAVSKLVEFLYLPKDIEHQAILYSFLIGSFFFAVAGFIECIQNHVFTSLDLGRGWFTALLNFIGGMLFLAGAVIDWFDSYTSQNCYAAGSLAFMIAASVQIVMWKDEQFGLTFLTALNVSDKPRSLQSRDDEHRATFSSTGAFFVNVWCFCGAVSVYNWNIEVIRHYRINTWRSAQMAFNEFLPCLFAHMMLLLASAIMRTPKLAPFRQMHIGLRMIGLLICANSTCTFLEFVFHEIRH